MPLTPRSAKSPMELDPFLLKKWDHAFSIFFDMNKDNKLEWNDFEELIDKIRTSRGEDSDDYKNALVAMKNIWEKLSGLADLNADNNVSVDEWKEMWFATVRKDADASWQKLYLDYMFRLFDSSGDDMIDLAEYVEVMGYYGIDRKQAIWAFDKFALGPNGQQVMAIDYDTYCRLWSEFFESLDPKKPGNFLFGDVSGTFDPSEIADTPESSSEEESDAEEQ